MKKIKKSLDSFDCEHTSWQSVWKIIPREKYIGGTIELMITEPSVIQHNIFQYENHRKTLLATNYYRLTISGISLLDSQSLRLTDTKVFDKKRRKWIVTEWKIHKKLKDNINRLPEGGFTGRICIDRRSLKIRRVSAPLNWNVIVYENGADVPHKPREPMSYRSFEKFALKAMSGKIK